MTAHHRAYMSTYGIGIALLQFGCLPNPPPYDACGGGDSHFYVVAPKSCSGHELVTLYERDDQLEVQNLLAPLWVATVGSTLHSRVELDDDSVYWVDPSQWRVLRSPKRDNQNHLTLFWSDVSSSSSSPPALSVLALNPNPKQLYVAEIGFDAADRPTSRIVGLDLDPSGLAATDGKSAPPSTALPSYARILAELADVSLSKVAIHGDRFYFTATTTPGIWSGPLDWSNTAHIADLSVTLPTAVTDFELVDATHLYALTAGGGSLQRVDPGTGTSEPILWLGRSDSVFDRLVHTDSGLHLFHCDMGYIDCRWARIEADGTSQVIASGLAIEGNHASFAGDARGVYVLGALTSEQLGHNRLLAFTESATAPEVLAAPFQLDVPMALDSEFVYVADHTRDFVDEVGTSATSTVISTDRLLRVRR